MQQLALDTRISRSTVPALAEYSKYRPFLRHDFYYSCAYCTMTESEATAVRFTIDHYEPQVARPDLIADYSNLMYSCDPCNEYKGNISPPPAARAAGRRFFRPDLDRYYDHFETYLATDGFRLQHKTEVGRFSIDFLELNRLMLRRLRGVRQQLNELGAFTAYGVAALRQFHIDRLPKHLKGPATRAIQTTVAVVESVEKQIDEVLRSYAKSDLIDADPNADERAKERARSMAAMKIAWPGVWRPSRKK